MSAPIYSRWLEKISNKYKPDLSPETNPYPRRLTQLSFLTCILTFVYLLIKSFSIDISPDADKNTEAFVNQAEGYLLVAFIVCLPLATVCLAILQSRLYEYRAYKYYALVLAAILTIVIVSKQI